MEDQSKNSGKTTRHRFKPGNTFGKGRPAGSRNKATIALQTILEGEGEELTRTAVEMALNGSEAAMRLCMERLLPVKRDRTVRFKVPSIEDASGVDEAIGTTLQAVANGNLTPSEGEMISRLLEARRRSIETVELEVRLRMIEENYERKLS